MIVDRIRQFREAGDRPCEADFALARQWLPPRLLQLYEGQNARDIVHSANTARWLIGHGHTDPDLLAAAFLHDVGKGAQRRGDRTIYVIAGHAGLARALGDARSRFELRRAIARSLAHSQSGAEALRRAGASGRAVDLTRRHHEPARGDRVLALLQQADAAS